MLLWVPHSAVGTGTISAIASQHRLNSELNRSIIVWCQFMRCGVTNWIAREWGVVRICVMLT